jgi:thiamine pyrophosphate-dependent acetolactate synthase large subunit-like protein
MDETGSDYLCRVLAAEGVETVFGLIGEGNVHLLDRLADAAATFVQARHEQAAVTMADGYARTTGQVGVCTVTHGPGATNAATGIASADRDNVPLVVLVGDTAIAGRETALQYLDHRTFAAPISGYTTRVESVETLPETIARAFDRARTRSAPAVVEVPVDVLLAVGAQLSGKTTRYGELFADAAVVQVDIDPAAIGTHRDPDVRLVGDARAAVAALADRVGADPDRASAVREAIDSAPAPREREFESHPEMVDPRAATVAISDAVPWSATRATAAC